MSASPLTGVRVVDLSRLLPGPLATQILASLGAEVFKVEEPKLGDPVRYSPPLIKSRSSLATLLLSGVRSLALDLKQAEAREVLFDLLAHADVLVESFRPGKLDEFGLAPTELRERFPHLVICSLSGWGQDGPMRDSAGHDLTYQATAGSLSATASMPDVPTADIGGAWSVVSSVLAALYQREKRSGLGVWIDASLYEAAMHSNLIGWAATAGPNLPVGEPHDLSGALPCYGIYRTRDDRSLAVAALEEHFWRRFCQVLGRDDLIDRRLERSAEARSEVARLVRGRTGKSWVKLAEEHDLPLAVVLSSEESLRHPQAQARDLVRQGDDTLLRLAFPARFDGGRPRAGGRLPRLGEATDETIEALSGSATALSSRARRRVGIGRKTSLRRWFGRWIAKRSGR